MSTEINRREAGDVTVIDASGRIAFDRGVEDLRAALIETAARGSRKVIVDLSGVPYIDTSGLGEIVSGYMRVARYGGDVKLCGLNKRIQHMLQVTGLSRIFDLQTDEDDALRSFRSGNQCPLDPFPSVA